jgi:rRNA-processing protein FCF1
VRDPAIGFSQQIRISLQIDLVKGMMDCLYAECKPCITDCVLAELEKLGQKYRVALKVAKVRHPLSLVLS